MFEIIYMSLCFGVQDVQNMETHALIRGGAWLPRLGGTIEDGGGKVDFETNIDLRSKETIPMIEFSLEPIEDITMSMSFFDFSTSGTGFSEAFPAMPFRFPGQNRPSSSPPLIQAFSYYLSALKIRHEGPWGTLF